MDDLACPLDPDGWLPHDVYRQLTALLPDGSIAGLDQKPRFRRQLVDEFWPLAFHNRTGQLENFGAQIRRATAMFTLPGVAAFPLGGCG